LADILDPNPFAKSVLAPVGNDSATDIYVAVGLALDRWEHCEMSFASLYSALIGAIDGNYVQMRAFGVITAPTTRYGMIWEANDARFDHGEHLLRKRGRSLLNLYKDAASRRNEIAHAMVMGDVLPNGDKPPLPPIWFLVPPRFSTRKIEPGTTKPKYRYSSREIRHFTACFEELHSRAAKLATEVSNYVVQQRS